MPMRRLAAAMLATVGWIGVTGAGSAPADTLDAALGLRRVLLVSAASGDDPAVRRQREFFAAMGANARERDLVLVEALGATPGADALRRRLALDARQFTVLLIGKDGGAKLRATHVLGADDLLPVIDAMPMRQDEMRRRRPIPR